jgi:MoaA/NifB/PqqE/SkfB family radical SAM enzyme
MLPDQEWTTDAKPLMFLDLKLGNICNLKCRICGSWSSSTFATEELQSLSPGEDRKSNYHYQMLRAGAWPRENPIFWKEIDQVVDQIQYIEFTGGEPFMIKEHFDLLRKLVDRGLAHNIELHYNTNGTQWPQGAEDIWRNFQHVEIAFSIDDVEQRFEYQRTGADWNNVNYNLQLFQEMRARNSNISLQVCCTVNIFNVLYLPMVAQWIEPQGFDFVYWNMLHDAPQHCIANLPESVKNKIAEHLKQSQFSEVYKKDIQGVIDFMFSRPGTDEKDLIKNIRTLDQRRSESLRTVAPELAEILNYD